MRPPSVYAKRSCPAGDPCDLLRLLHGPHRVGLRLVMILLSQHGWSAATIAELLGCDPRTVRRWVHRYHREGTVGWPTGPDRAARAVAARGWRRGSPGCCASPRRGPSLGCMWPWADRHCRCGPCTGGFTRSRPGGGPAWLPRETPTGRRS